MKQICIYLPQSLQEWWPWTFRKLGQGIQVMRLWEKLELKLKTVTNRVVIIRGSVSPRVKMSGKPVQGPNISGTSPRDKWTVLKKGDCQKDGEREKANENSEKRKVSHPRIVTDAWVLGRDSSVAGACDVASAGTWWQTLQRRELWVCGVWSFLPWARQRCQQWLPLVTLTLCLQDDPKQGKESTSWKPTLWLWNAAPESKSGAGRGVHCSMGTFLKLPKRFHCAARNEYTSMVSTICYGLDCFLPNSYVEALTPSINAPGDGALRR